MKKLLIALIILAMLMTATSCAKGDVAKQEQALNDYVLKHFGAYEIVDKSADVLDTVMSYTLRDTTDGFEYLCATQEVPWADLGFSSALEDTTIVIDSTFRDVYMQHLLDNKIDKNALQSILDKYSDISLKLDKTTNYALQSTESYPAIALICNTPKSEPLAEIAALFKAADTRNMLNEMTLCMYTVTNGVLAADASFRHDFFTNYTCNADEWNGVATLSGYFYSLNPTTKIEITSVKTKYSRNNITLKEGWAWASSISSDGTYLTFTMDGKNYEFFTSLCTQPITGDLESYYGLMIGSFLDIMAPESSGSRPIIIAMYAQQYPDTYHCLGVHWQEITSDNDTSTDEGGTK